MSESVDSVLTLHGQHSSIVAAGIQREAHVVLKHHHDECSLCC